MKRRRWYQLVIGRTILTRIIHKIAVSLLKSLFYLRDDQVPRPKFPWQNRRRVK